MRLDYKILWIDDETNFVVPLKSEIEKHITEKGFCPQIDAPEIIPSLNLENLKDYDLILIDYKLTHLSEQSGDKLIENIRENKVFSNIVFYSSNTLKVREETREKRLNGIHILDRTEFDLDKLDAFYDLIDFFMEKEMDSNSMRGIAMSEIASFDALIWQIIESQLSDKKNVVAAKIKKQKQDHCKVCLCSTDDELWSLAASEKGTIFFNSAKRKDVLHSKILSGLIDFEEEYNEIKNNYHERLIIIRNDLAHKIDDPLTELEKIQFRQDLIKFRGILNKLKDKLC